MAGIDIHTHFVPKSFPAVPGGRSDLAWPSMKHECAHAHVMISGSRYRTVPNTSWDAALRGADMDAMQISHQVLSPIPELLSYWLPAAEARVLVRYLNESLARLVAAHPERFHGLGAVPLQDTELAIAELEYVVGPLGLSGVEIATHVNGRSIGDPQFRPFFAAAERLGAAVFVHALRPAGKDRLVGPAALEQVVAFPGDVGLAIASMMTGGSLEAHPRLRIAFSHAGGAFSMMLPRLQHGWLTTPEIKACMPRPPREYAKRVYVDTLAYDANALGLVLKSFGGDRVMIGTDYPFRVRDRNPHGTLDALGLEPVARAALQEGNARRFLNLPPIERAGNKEKDNDEQGSWRGAVCISVRGECLRAGLP